MATGTARKGGFTLLEVLAAITVVAMLLAALAIAARDARRNANIAGSVANLKQFGAATANYGQDHADRMWGFTRTDWQGNPTVMAAAEQATDIIRRRGDPFMLTPANWVPHILYSQLILADYLDLSLPASFFASPGDRYLLTLQTRPPHTPQESRARFGSSYELPPAFFSNDARIGDVMTIGPGFAHYSYTFGNGPMTPRSLNDVRFPAQKALLFETFQRFFGPRDAFFGYAQARFPVLAVDGAAAVRAAADINLGFNPDLPLQTAGVLLSYEPQPHEPPTLSGGMSELVYGRCRWTRSGLRGRDWGGREVPWVP